MRAKTIAHCSQHVKQMLINCAEGIREDTWEGIGWRGNRGTSLETVAPTTTLSRRERKQF
jgi:hypothetical protein